MIPTYSKPRFLYDNFLDAATLTAAAISAGRLSGASKQGTGGAGMRIGGTYAGPADVQVTVVLESAGDIGVAAYRWRTSLTASGSWEATGQTTASSFTTLTAGGVDYGDIVFDASTDTSDDDFDLGDSWSYWCYATHGPAKAIDRNRNTYLESTSTSTTLVIDLGSAQTVTALLVQDHNLDSITWQANTSNAWSSPAYQIAASSNDPSVLYPSETYRYWRLVFTTGATTAKIGGLYVGTHLELSDAMSAHTSWGSSVTKQLNVSSKAGDAGELWRQLLSVTRAFDLTFDTISNSDADSLETMFDALVNLTTRVISPLWVHYFYDVEASCRLCHWINGLDQTYRYVDVNQVVMSLQEVARTRACD